MIRRWPLPTRVVAISVEPSSAEPLSTWPVLLSTTARSQSLDAGPARRAVTEPSAGAVTRAPRDRAAGQRARGAGDALGAGDAHLRLRRRQEHRACRIRGRSGHGSDEEDNTEGYSTWGQTHERPCSRDVFPRGRDTAWCDLPLHRRVHNATFSARDKEHLWPVGCLQSSRSSSPRRCACSQLLRPSRRPRRRSTSVTTTAWTTPASLIPAPTTPAPRRSTRASSRRSTTTRRCSRTRSGPTRSRTPTRSAAARNASRVRPRGQPDLREVPLHGPRRRPERLVHGQRDVGGAADRLRRLRLSPAQQRHAGPAAGRLVGEHGRPRARHALRGDRGRPDPRRHLLGLRRQLVLQRP